MSVREDRIRSLALWLLEMKYREKFEDLPSHWATYTELKPPDDQELGNEPKKVIQDVLRELERRRFLRSTKTPGNPRLYQLTFLGVHYAQGVHDYVKPTKDEIMKLITDRLEKKDAGLAPGERYSEKEVRKLIDCTEYCHAALDALADQGWFEIVTEGKRKKLYKVTQSTGALQNHPPRADEEDDPNKPLPSVGKPRKSLPEEVATLETALEEGFKGHLRPFHEWSAEELLAYDIEKENIPAEDFFEVANSYIGACTIRVAEIRELRAKRQKTKESLKAVREELSRALH